MHQQYIISSDFLKPEAFNFNLTIPIKKENL